MSFLPGGADPSASSPPALPRLEPVIDDLSNMQVDGGQDAQQHAHRYGAADAVQQAEVDEEAAGSIKAWPCGCDEASNHYLENFATFQRHVREGLKNLTSQDVEYSSVEALMVYWKGGDVPEVADEARRLGALFQEAPYDFTVTHLEIDYQSLTQSQINRSFRKALRAIEDRVSDENNLFENLLILYYGGHGVVDRGDRLWQPKKNSVKNIIWSDYQSMMHGFECDILYLFDCCYSLAMVETVSSRSLHSRRCEILCSSGLKEQSGARDKTLFTKALRELLAKKRDAVLEGVNPIGGLTFEALCDTMTGRNIRDTLRAEPRWKRVAPNPALRRRISSSNDDFFYKRYRVGASNPPHFRRSDPNSSDEDKIEARSQLSDTRILIKIRLANPAKGLSTDDWLKWFEQRPHNVAHVDVAVVKRIEYVGIFESESCLALITILLWLWHNMEQDPAYEPLGIVRSSNLLRMPLDEVSSAQTVDPDTRDGKLTPDKTHMVASDDIHLILNALASCGKLKLDSQKLAELEGSNAKAVWWKFESLLSRWGYEYRDKEVSNIVGLEGSTLVETSKKRAASKPSTEDTIPSKKPRVKKSALVEDVKAESDDD